jgi:hypothetical protein
MSTSTSLAEGTNKRKSNEDLEAGAAGKQAATERTTEATSTSTATNVTTNVTSSSSSSTKSPYDAYMEKKSAFMTEQGYIGSILVKGIGRKHPQADDGDGDDDDEDDSDDEDDDEEEDTDTITQEQMNSLRCLLITQNRADKLEAMQALILGDQQEGSSCMMFNTRPLATRFKTPSKRSSPS